MLNMERITKGDKVHIKEYQITGVVTKVTNQTLTVQVRTKKANSMLEVPISKAVKVSEVSTTPKKKANMKTPDTAKLFLYDNKNELKRVKDNIKLHLELINNNSQKLSTYLSVTNNLIEELKSLETRNTKEEYKEVRREQKEGVLWLLSNLNPTTPNKKEDVYFNLVKEEILRNLWELELNALNRLETENKKKFVEELIILVRKETQKQINNRESLPNKEQTRKNINLLFSLEEQLSEY